MKHTLITLAALSPGLALAHEGHGGIGLLHHAMDLIPLVALAGLAVWGISKFKNND